MTEPGTDSMRRLLLDQLSISWGLLDYHLDSLTDDDLFWEPSALIWTMHKRPHGWVPDWADHEPQPIPVPTAAWLTWHVGWWWSTATAHLTSSPVPDRNEIGWPGTAKATVAWLTALHDAYRADLAETRHLDRPAGFPWPTGSGRDLADLAAWVNVELMKNAAEIGQLRLMRQAGSPRQSRGPQ